MIEPTKTKTHRDIMENPWMRDVVGPMILIIPAILVLYIIYKSSVIPEEFKPFVLASGLLVATALFLEMLIITAKIADLITNKLTKHGKKLL